MQISELISRSKQAPISGRAAAELIMQLKDESAIDPQQWDLDEKGQLTRTSQAPASSPMELGELFSALVGERGHSPAVAIALLLGSDRDRFLKAVESLADRQELIEVAANCRSRSRSTPEAINEVSANSPWAPASATDPSSPVETASVRQPPRRPAQARSIEPVAESGSDVRAWLGRAGRGSLLIVLMVATGLTTFTMAGGGLGDSSTEQAMAATSATAASSAGSLDLDRASSTQSAKPDWPTVLAELDHARAALFSDPHEQMDTTSVNIAGSSAEKSDQQALNVLAQHGLRAQGYSNQLRAIEIGPVTEKSAQLVVTDIRSAYRLVTADGSTAQSVVERAQKRWKVKLTKTDAGWRYVAVDATQ